VFTSSNYLPFKAFFLNLDNIEKATGLMSRDALSLVECCVQLKIAAQGGLSGQVHCHSEFATC
jgi:hypothetical protein